MSIFLRASTAAMLLAAALVAPLANAPAIAAQGYGNCSGFIDSLPATITKQGTWCLRHDLATSISSGQAITVATNNVTIDCNDFKIGGTAAGAGTSAYGIHAIDRFNTTVRHCNLRGFFDGVVLDISPGGTGNGGNVVEDNRFDGNRYAGMIVWGGDNSSIRGNAINDTGGSTFLTGQAFGMMVYTDVDIRDNTISGVTPQAAGGDAIAYGIYTSNNTGGSIEGNRIRALAPAGAGEAFGIYNFVPSQLIIKNNVLVGAGIGEGLYCDGSTSRAIGNIVNGFATSIDGCRDDGNSI